MSFYFNLQTEKKVSEQSVLDALENKGVEVRHDLSVALYFIPGQSLRGVAVYVTDSGYDVGVNAFTTREDIRLCRDIAAVLGALTEATITAEDAEDDKGLSPDAVKTYGGEAWVDSRWNEAKAVVSMLSRDDANIIGLVGHERQFGLSHQNFANIDAATDAEISAALADGVQLQSITDKDDILIADLVEAKPKALTGLRKFARQLMGKSTDAPASIDFFWIVEDTRTLTPLILSPTQNSKVLLIPISQEERWVPFDQFATHVRALSHREYGTGVFDTTLSGDDFNALFQRGSKT